MIRETGKKRTLVVAKRLTVVTFRKIGIPESEISSETMFFKTTVNKANNKFKI